MYALVAHASAALLYWKRHALPLAGHGPAPPLQINSMHAPVAQGHALRKTFSVSCEACATSAFGTMYWSRFLCGHLNVRHPDHFRRRFIELFGPPDFLESRHQIADAQSPFFRATEIMQDSASWHHDQTLADGGDLMHRLRHHQRSQ